jgi:hypothetical protein
MAGRATLIYLLRHGEVQGAETRRFIGHLDVPLSPWRAAVHHPGRAAAWRAFGRALLQ